MIFTALLQAKPASVSEVQAILSELTKRAAPEAGMISYSAAYRCDDPTRFPVTECYRHRQAWRDQMQSRARGLGCFRRTSLGASGHHRAGGGSFARDRLWRV